MTNACDPQESKVRKILRLPATSSRTGYSRSAIYDRLDPKSRRYDPEFPRPVSLGARAIGFVEAEIENWIERRISKSRSVSIEGR